MFNRLSLSILCIDSPLFMRTCQLAEEKTKTYDTVPSGKVSYVIGGFVAVQPMPLRCVCQLLSGFGLERLDFGKVARKVVGGEGIVLEVAGEELVVGGHVDESVA